MSVELSNGYISIGCKSASGLFDRRFGLLSKDGKKRIFVPLNELDWDKTVLVLAYENCPVTHSTAKQQNADSQKNTGPLSSDEFRWTFVFSRRWKLPKSWRLLGEEIEVRYHVEKKADGTFCREKYVLRLIDTAGAVRPWSKYFTIGWKQRFDIRVIRDACSTPVKTYVKGKLSWEGTLDIVNFTGLLRKLKPIKHLLPTAAIKPQVLFKFLPPETPGNYVRIKGELLARGAVAFNPGAGIKWELRYLLGKCNLGFYELGKHPYGEIKPMCTSRLINSIRLRNISGLPGSSPSNPNFLPPDKVDPVIPVFRRSSWFD